MRKNLLIVWVEYEAVWHFVEAMEAAANYHAAHPNLEIHVLVNKATPYQLGEFCKWIHKTYAIDIKDVNQNKVNTQALQEIPKSFDYVIFPKRLKYTPQDYPDEMLQCNLFLKDFFKPVIWGGFNDTPSSENNGIKEQLYSPFKMILGEELTQYAKSLSTGHPVFSVMLKGASQEKIWPSFYTWKTILLHIKKVYPNATFLITGISSIHTSDKTKTEGAKAKINAFINSVEGAVNCYDIGLEKQLAVIQHSNVFISPHTGFAFLAPCLGTPWLTLSGSRWADFDVARMPFYSVLPKCKHYPCHSDMKMECRLRLKLRQPVACMGLSLRNKKNEIIDGISHLLDENFSFEKAFTLYEKHANQKKVNLNKLWRIPKYKEYKGLN